MPDKRSHRGPHPEDQRLFEPSVWPELRRATADLSLLMTRGYAEKSALKLVGDRFNLTERQRTAVMRCSCSDFALARRRSHEATREDVAGQTLLVDGYNVLTTIEAALAGGFILLGRDGCYRDMASMHGTFRKVQETAPAITLLGETVASLAVGRCVFFLDSPVSNSGRLKTVIHEIANAHRWHWQLELVMNPDPILSEAEEVVATADSVVLDRCQRWFNLARVTVAATLPDVQIVDLSHPPPE